jgi:hypothetical protein
MRGVIRQNADLVRRRHRGARVADHMQIRRFCVSRLAIVTTAEEDDRPDATGKSPRRTGSGTSAAGEPPVRFLSGVLPAICCRWRPGGAPRWSFGMWTDSACQGPQR